MQTWLGGSTHITMPNFLETGLSKSDIAIFQIFRMSAACRRYLRFLKLQNFIGYLGGEGRDASAHRISFKSLNRLWRY